MKKIWGCLLIGILILLSTGTVFAAEEPDFDKNGSINVYMRSTDGNLVTGGYLEVYKVADVYKSNKIYKCVYTEDFAGSGYPLSEDGIAELALGLYNYAVENDVHGDLYENKTGTIKLNNLTCGLYLIDNQTAPEGYCKINPFLVALPLQVGNTWLYEVDASPKMSLLEQEHKQILPDPKPIEPDPKPIEPDPKPILPDPKPILPDPKPILPNPSPFVPGLKPIIPSPNPLIPGHIQTPEVEQDDSQGKDFLWENESSDSMLSDLEDYLNSDMISPATGDETAVYMKFAVCIIILSITLVLAYVYLVRKRVK